MATRTKIFGFWTLTFLVIANMVGAGVFTTSGFALQDLGSPRLVMAAWIVGGLIAYAGAVGYGQLARVMPESGGEYLFLSRAVHPLFGFVAGWVSLIAGFSGAIAFAATAFESYLVPEAARPDWLPIDCVAVLTIVGAGMFHGVRPRLGASVQNGVVILKLGLLAAVIMFAATRFSSHDWHTESLAGAETGQWALVKAFAESLVWISLSYSGFNAAIYIADEARDARTTIPRALVTGTALVTVLYVLLNAIFVYASPAVDIAGAADVAVVATRALGGDAFANFVRMTIAAALLTSVFSMMMAAPRVYAKMADDGLMPEILRIRGDTPRAAIVTQVALSVILVLASNLQGLLSYLSLTLSVSAACTVACLFSPSVRRQPWHSPTHFLPALYIVCTLLAAVLMAVADPTKLAVSALTFVTGAATYAVIQWSRHTH